MHGPALLLVGLLACGEPIERTPGVEEVGSPSFLMPLTFDPSRLGEVEKVRLFVSEDSGKTWQHREDYATTAREVSFLAPRDGLYWFALQAVTKAGKQEPADVKDLTPAMKVLVRTERRAALKPRKSVAELEREAEELRQTAEELRQRNAELKVDVLRKSVEELRRKNAELESTLKK
jgi:hypothetical protein